MTATRIRRTLFAALAFTILVIGLASCDNSQPYGDHRHWNRYGDPTVDMTVFVGPDAMSHGYFTLVDNVVRSVNARSPYFSSAVVRGDVSPNYCSQNGVTACIVVERAGNFACGAGAHFAGQVAYAPNGHVHYIGDQFSAMNVDAGCGLPLITSQAVVCHEILHALGVGHDPDPNGGGQWPCGGTNEGLPTDHDMDVVNALHTSGD